MQQSKSLSNLLCQEVNGSSDDEDETYVPTAIRRVEATPRRKFTKNENYGLSLKIIDEKEIDLTSKSAYFGRYSDTSDDETCNQTRHLYPVEEFSEDTSRASSKMNMKIQSRHDEVQNWLERRNTFFRLTPPARPSSRRSELRPSDGSFVIHQNSATSVESHLHPDVAEVFQTPQRQVSFKSGYSDGSSNSRDFIGDCKRTPVPLPRSSKSSSPTNLHNDAHSNLIYNLPKKLPTANEIADFHARQSFLTMKSLSRSEMDLRVVDSVRSLALSSSKSSSSIWKKCFCFTKSPKMKT